MRIFDKFDIASSIFVVYLLGMSTSEERITELETRFAWLEDFTNSLQAIVVEHSELIDRLKTENKLLRDKMVEIDDAMQDMPNVKPPHY